MANYQHSQYYQRSRPGGRSGGRLTKPVLALIALAIIYLIARAIFGGGKENTIANDLEQLTVNQTTTNLNVAETNTNTGGAAANTNSASTNTAISTSSGPFSLANDCTAVRSRGSADTASVSLTFNVGSTKEGSIDTVLSALTSAGVPAAFFATGDVAEGNSGLVKKIHDQGFPVYNGGDSLTRFTDLTPVQIATQLSAAESSISGITSATTKPFFRPPYGSIDEETTTAITDAGYCPVTWTIDALDWSTDSTAASSTERVLSRAANGSVILMQASNSITGEILDDVITGLREKGFTIVELSGLLAS